MSTTTSTTDFSGLFAACAESNTDERRQSEDPTTAEAVGYRDGVQDAFEFVLDRLGQVYFSARGDNAEYRRQVAELSELLRALAR
jgi:hypothetical protein